METRTSLTIPDHLVGERADKVVAELAGVSRQASRQMFDEGVLVDDTLVSPSQRLAGGVIEFAVPAVATPIRPEFAAFDVAYEDPHLLVVDKPAGLLVHPGAGKERPTLVGGLLYRFPDLAGVGEAGREGIVHRLDQGTSGLLLVARSNEVHHLLQAQLKRRDIHRNYLALVHGVPAMPTGTIDAPIGRDPAHPTRKKVAAGGRPSRTHYRVRSSHQVAALLEVDLETGRTHQIRVHLAAIGHPVVGDQAYSRRRDPIPVRRMFLHAHRLELVHPINGDQLVIESPLPADLASVMVDLARVYPDPSVPS
ncbi:MAG TPA: RluA family pseudouridine synthase [Acidimicrobiia bacterium]|nr:RluA family pseudouridine synthase [Acidimicrobiia bacterium]